MEKLEGIDPVNAHRLISALMTILVQRAGGTGFVDNDEVKGMLQELKEGTSALAEQVADGTPDEELSAQLTELHDLFHHLQEKWYEEGDEHHH